ncbi:MAG: hypothetical protein ACP6IS_06510 [Candidatus Asgardarchaeia archaeon]
MPLSKRYLDLAEYLVDFLKTTPSNLWSAEAENLLSEFISLAEQTYSKINNSENMIVVYFGSFYDALFSVKTGLLLSDFVAIQDNFLSSLLPKLMNREIMEQKSLGYYLQLYSSTIEPLKEFILNEYVYFIPNFTLSQHAIGILPQLKLELINSSLKAFSDDVFKSLLYAHRYNWPLFTNDTYFINSFLTKLNNEVIPFFDFLNSIGLSSHVSSYMLHNFIRQLKKYAAYFEVIFNQSTIQSAIDSMNLQELISCRKCIGHSTLFEILKSYNPSFEKDFIIDILDWLETITDKNPDRRIDILRILSAYNISLMYNITPLLSLASPFLSTIIDIPKMAEEFLGALAILGEEYRKSRIREDKISFVISSSPSLLRHEYVIDTGYITYFKEAYTKRPDYFEKLLEILHIKT